MTPTLFFISVAMLFPLLGEAGGVDRVIDRCLAPGAGLRVYDFTEETWSDQSGKYTSSPHPSSISKENVTLTPAGIYLPGPSVVPSMGIDICHPPLDVNGSLVIHSHIRKDSMVNPYEYIVYSKRPGVSTGAAGFPHEVDQLLVACRLVNTSNVASIDFDVQCIVAQEVGEPLVFSTSDEGLEFFLTLPTTFVISLIVEARPMEATSLATMYINGTLVGSKEGTDLKVLSGSGDFFIGRSDRTAADGEECGAFEGFIQSFVLGQDAEDAPSVDVANDWELCSSGTWLQPTDAPTPSPTPMPTKPPTHAPSPAPTTSPTPLPPTPTPTEGTTTSTSTTVHITAGQVAGGAPSARAESGFVNSISSGSPVVLGIVLGSIVILCTLFAVGLLVARRRQQSHLALATTMNIDLVRTDELKGGAGGAPLAESRSRSRRSSKSGSKSPRGGKSPRGSAARANYSVVSLPTSDAGYGRMPTMNTMSTATTDSSDYRPMPSGQAGAYSSTAAVATPTDPGYSTMPTSAGTNSPYNDVNLNYATGELKCD
jgi:hypothetical protein